MAMAYDLGHHGDAETAPGLLDLAVNVRGSAPPAWLRGRLERGLDRLGSYPDQTAAVRAVARRHDRDPAEVLLTAGGAEAFVLVARALRPDRAMCVHPSFTEPESALLAAGHPVDRLVLEPPYVLDPAQVPDDVDLVVLGNPTNPTGVVHERVDRLCRPGRVVVVDEAFADAVPGEPHSLAGRGDLPGLVVVRSLTKTWALPGLRVGYLLAPPGLVEQLRSAQPLWPVSTLALIALETCLARGPVASADKDARVLERERDLLAAALADLGVEVSPGSRAPYLLCRVAGREDVRERLRDQGIAVRRGDTFPGLSPEHWRVAVRGPAERDLLVQALGAVL
ncbi:MAG: aminotransferase class [Frankiales bacterium]|jgi:histidinol-phosphate aminotransferase|nr:aminotransferase class [Frankiales bacterium]